MTRTTRRHALALLGGSFLASCTEAPLVLDTPEDGPFEGGIGGTGIVGTLVGFGSLLVNGLRVTVSSQTRYSTVFGRIGLDQLKPGMPLTVYARRTRGALMARSVQVDYPLVGRVQHGPSGFTVNAVPVRLERGATGALLPGLRVAIGGVWTRHGVSASFVSAAPSGPDVIAGTVNAGGTGSFRIGTAAIDARGSTPAAGSYAVALGQFHADGFAATEVQRGRFNAAPDLRNLSVDGFLEPISTAPGFRIAGLGHSFAEQVKLGSIGTRRSVIFGPYDGRFQASTAYIVPRDFGPRATVLRPADLTSNTALRVAL